MFSGRGFKTALLAACALAAASAPGFGNTISYNLSSGEQSTDWSTVLSVPMFDGSLGTLNSVSVGLTGTVTGALKLSNTGTFQSVATQTGATAGTPAGITGTTSSGSKNVTGLTSAITAKLFVGELISGPGIPAGATIATVNPTSIVLSAKATASGSNGLSLACTASKCPVWNLTYGAAPPSVIPTNTVNSNLSASITLQAGPLNMLTALPAATFTDALQYGPKFDPDGYNFNAVYNGTPLTLAQAQALSPPGGIQAPGGGTSNPCALQLYGTCTVGLDTYSTGVTHSGLSDSDSDSIVFNTPLDLAMFVGSGLYDFAMFATGFSDHTGGGNIAFFSETNAQGDVSVTYDYTPAPEPVSLSLMGAGLLGLRFARRRKSA